MSNSDKILEAEEKILSFQAELERLGSAAKLLHETQQNTKAVTEAAVKLTTALGEFAEPAGKAVEKLSEVEFKKKFDSLQFDLQRLGAETQSILERLDSIIRAGLSEIVSLLSTLSQKVDLYNTDLAGRIERNQESNEKNYSIQSSQHLSNAKLLKILIGLVLTTFLSMIVFCGFMFLKNS
jgi:hypothetical protein